MSNGPACYDLRDRLIGFAVLVARIAERMPSTRVGKHVAGQLLRCGTAAAPSHAEAQSGESRRDFIHKMKLGLKELRETQVWLEFALRLEIGDTGALQQGIEEADQLIRIFYTSIATARRNERTTPESA